MGTGWPMHDYDNLTSHHEDTESYENHFRSKRKLLIEAFCKFVNPSNGLMHIVSKEIMPVDAAQSVKDAHDIGQGHSLVFMQVKVTSDLGMRNSLYVTIKKNKLPLFRSKNVVTTSKAKK